MYITKFLRLHDSELGTELLNQHKQYGHTLIIKFSIGRTSKYEIPQIIYISVEYQEQLTSRMQR